MTLLRRRLPWREPAEVAAVLARLHGEQGLIWLDGDGGELGRRITLASDPLEQHCCRGLPGDPEAPVLQTRSEPWSLDRLAELRRRGVDRTDQPLAA